MSDWTIKDIPPQLGRSAVVTGTGGIGFEDALALARARCAIIIAGRSPEKGELAVARIRAAFPDAKIRFEQLDLASLRSIKEFGSRMRAQRTSLDILINNAAVMTPPTRKVTSDGFELQLGTNYLGHFALTAELLPLLRNAEQSRVISISSIAARSGMINFEDLQAQRDYRPMQAYSQSKLACLMFAIELQKRSQTAGWKIESIAAHPGISRTELIPNGAGPRSLAGFTRSFLWFLFQPAAQGALPTLFAATSSLAKAGGYYGPKRLSETRGAPALARVPPRANDAAVSARLWEVSEKLTGACFK
ncbi:SDR family oxidoreductase [Bradyrhizobium japonicum]|uniref:SDR family oxidoreductase n=1 Tax=Bradyrhizobium japonicum TaxID=375 RepID=UPI00200D761A|nr:SDR family oxidoreductase [Bradyrhizobium japonicum]UQD70972.1 SDR family oxidoreductase [Bradyrhizobium japonicum]